MKTPHLSKRQVGFICFLSLALLACGGGGGGSDSGPNVRVLPSSFNYGIITTGNLPPNLEVKIENTGNENLRVSSIFLSGEANADFDLDLDGGADPCGSGSPTIAPGDSCTFEVLFTPIATGNFSAYIGITTNDRNRTVPLTGSYEDVNDLTVRINQVLKNCTTNDWTAYVSVIDQGKFPYTGLNNANFTVDVNGGANLFDGLLALPPVSIVVVMDYSRSIRENPEIQSDMEEGVIALINAMGASDELEIIKFHSQVEIVQRFESDKPTLIDAVQTDYNYGDATQLYDAVSQAVTDFESAVLAPTNSRWAILVFTDGEDSGLGATLDQVINEANTENISGVPIFPIALGNDWNVIALNRMANETGGLLYEASGSDNLQNIYLQLASLLFDDQYALSFDDPPQTIRIDTT